MKTKRMYAAMAAMVIGVISLMSCNENEALGNEPKQEADKDELIVHTEIQSKSTGVVSSWKDGDNLGLFITKGQLGSNYHDYSGYSNVKSTRKDGGWTQAPNVYLSGEAAFVYAYFPYASDSQAGGGTAVEMDARSQNDYMYGTHADPKALLNSDNPDVVIHMKHATALLQFNMYKKNYTATGKVTRIKIVGTGGTLYRTATLNCQNGMLTMKEDAGAEGVFIENIGTGLLSALSNTPSDIESFYPKVLTLPATGRMTGDLTAVFTIDGKEYSYPFPSGTAWESGKKYTYTICLNGTEIHLGGTSPDGSIQINDWGTGPSGSVDLQ